MVNLGPMGQQNRSNLVPTPPKGDPIAGYATYLQAQRAVDYLSDNHFQVQAVTIVGSDLKMVERVTGRLTYGRVALAGALSGAWFGLFVGLLLSLFGGGPSSILLTAILIGAGFGMLFGVISYALTGGRRDFTSTSQIVASEYQVLCLPELAEDARRLLIRLEQESGTPGGVNAASMPSPVRPGGSGPGQPGPVPPAGGSAPAEGVSDTTGAQSAAAEQSSPTGPTYGEMIERQRRERAEAEARAHQENRAEHG